MEALDLVQCYHITNPLRLVEQLGIKYFFVDLPTHIKGVTWFDGDITFICLNNAIKDSPLLYPVVAHELKHALDHTWYRGGDTTAIEHEADVFERELMTYFYKENTNIIPLDSGGGGVKCEY